MILLVVIVLLYSNIQVRVLKKGYANFFGYTFFQVATGSMEPAISPEDIVLVKIGETFQSGDIVTYQTGNDFVTHRVVNVEDSVVVLKGDANNTNDVPIQKKFVLGKVVKVFTGLQVWKNILMTPKVIISLFVTLILFDFAFAYKGESKKKKRKKKRKYKKRNKKVLSKQKIKDEDIEILEVDF